MNKDSLGTAHKLLPLRLLVPMALMTGVATGAGAWLLKWLCHLLHGLIFGLLHPDTFNWSLLLWPPAGILLTFLAGKYLFRQQVSDACARLSAHLRNDRLPLSPNIIWETLCGCTLTIGLGASAGTESPIAYSGAAMGNSLGRIFGVNARSMRVLVACGAGAGIGAIFKSPIGGLFFVLEILRLELSTNAVTAAGVASLTGALTAYVLSGCTPDIHYSAPFPPDPHTYAAVILLGILTGLYARWYDFCSDKAIAMLSGMRHAAWKPIVSGAILGLAVLIMPGLYGDGYTLMSHLLDGRGSFIASYSAWAGTHSMYALLAIAAGMLLVKGSLVALANNGGGVAGDFSPTLFAGCIGGWLFAIVCNSLTGTTLPPASFACIGMGAAMAAILRTPLMAIFITVEATMAYSMLLPVSVAALTAFATAKISRLKQHSETDG